MYTIFGRIFSDDAVDVRGKAVGMYALLFGANLAVWAWALVTFHDYPLLLGTALLATALGSGTRSMPTTSPPSTM